MSLSIKMLKCLPVGVDLGSSSIKLAQLRTAQEGTELLAIRCCDIPPDSRDNADKRLKFCAGELRTALHTGGFRGRRAILCLPASAVFLEPIRVPVAAGKVLDELVRDEIASRLPFPAAEATIRHVKAGTVYANGEEMQEVVVVAAPRAVLTSYLNMARQAGLEVEGVNVEACALLECFSRLFRRDSDQERVTLFLDIGATSTQVVIAHGPRVAFARNILLGGRNLEQAIAAGLHIVPAEARTLLQRLLTEAKGTAAEDELFQLLDGKVGELAGEIHKNLQYHQAAFGERAIERMIVVGGQAHNTRLVKAIAERLNLPAVVGDPLSGLRLAEAARAALGDEFKKAQPVYAVAIGLSLGAAQAA